jgi:hypothetical protein
MNWSEDDDPIERESRRSAIVRRLISHGVRTKIITRLAGVSKSRQATLRRRLMVNYKARRRGPAKSSLELFLGSPKARAEAAALAAFFSLINIPVELKGPYIPHHASFDFSERLCEIYEAYCAFFPQTEIELEELILLRRALASGQDMALARCRVCKCLILVNRFETGQRACGQCEPPPSGQWDPQASKS